MKQVISYKTFDNMVFETQEEAEKHEDKILEALDTIADVCDRHKECIDCPFYNPHSNNIDCRLADFSPHTWSCEAIK